MSADKNLRMLSMTDNRNDLVNKEMVKVMDRLVITLPSATLAGREVRIGRLWEYVCNLFRHKTFY